MTKVINASWGKEWGTRETTLFWYPYGDHQILDYAVEADRERIYKMCGGRCTYISNSGETGKGYICIDQKPMSGGSIYKMGYYNLKDHSLHAVELAQDIKVMVPYNNGIHDATEETSPIVVVKFDEIYFTTQRTLRDVLRCLLWKRPVTASYQKRRQSLYNVTGGKEGFLEEEVELKFYNLFGKTQINPWHFAEDLLRDYVVPEKQTELYRQLRVARLQDGEVVNTVKIGSFICAKSRSYQGGYDDPIESSRMLESLCDTSEWEFWEGGLVFREKRGEFRTTEILHWATPEALDKKISRIASKFLGAYEKDFEEYMKYKVMYPRIPEIWEKQTFNSVLFALDPERCFGHVRRALAEKVESEVKKYAIEFAIERGIDNIDV